MKNFFKKHNIKWWHLALYVYIGVLVAYIPYAWAADTAIQSRTPTGSIAVGDSIPTYDLDQTGGASRTVQNVIDLFEATVLTITADWDNTANPWAVNELNSDVLTATEIGAAYDTEAELTALFAAKEVQLDNEAGLYAVLSDVSDFLQSADVGAAYDTEAELDALFALKAPLASPTFTGAISNTPQSLSVTTEANITLTSSILLLTGDDDTDNDAIDLQNGTTAGQLLFIYGVAAIDSDDTITIAMTDTTCTSCPTVLLDAVADYWILKWTGATWAVIGGSDILAAQISDQNAGTAITADLEEEAHASEHNEGGADIVDRFTEGSTLNAFGATDATPDVSNGGTGVVHFWESGATSTTTITDFDDADDHSEFSAGDWFVLICDDGDTTIDFSANANIEGNAGTDFTCSATQETAILFVFDGGKWVADMREGMSDPTTLSIGDLTLPSDESADGTLDALGKVHIRGDEDRFSVHAGAGGEIAGEVTKSMLDYGCWSFDPGNAYDSDAEIFLFDVEADVWPNGITIDEWKLSCNVDPDVELALDLKRATAWIGLGSAAVIDVLDTTAGVSSEDTDANINADAVVAAGQHLYLSFDSDPEGTCVQAIFCMEWHSEED